MNPKLLVVDDERGIVDMIQSYFQTQYDILTAYSGQEALKKVACKPDLILLDINMPGMDGLTVCQQIREHIACPILFLTARIESSDKIIGFQAGADDYIVKPFDLDELFARVRALLRRSAGRAEPMIERGRLQIKPATHEVIFNGESILLSSKEFALLLALAERPGLVLSRAQLEEKLYNWDSSIGSNAIEVHIHHLRKKLSEDAIKTVRGVGYILET